MTVKAGSDIRSDEVVAENVLLAGEDMSRGNLVVYGTGSDASKVVSQESGSTNETITDGGTERLGQTFTVPRNVTATKVGLNAGIVQTGSGLTVEIRTGSYTGTLIASGTSSGHTGGVLAWIEVTLSASVALSPGTTYYLVVYAPTNTGNSALYPFLRGNTSDAYAGGSASTSSDSGATWAAHGTIADWNFRIIGIATTSGRANKASTNLEANLLGFLEEDVLSGAPCIINNLPIFTGLSGRTAGTVYYVGENGALATSGTKKVGIAISSTTLLRQYQ